MSPDSNYNETTGNKVSRSSCRGISITRVSSFNEVKRNHVFLGGDFDLYEDVDGTGNSWGENKYKTCNF